jgi:hypothetical protein
MNSIRLSMTNCARAHEKPWRSATLPRARHREGAPMSEQSLADRATAERAADIARTTCGIKLVNREVHPRELTKGDSDA